MIFQSHTGCKVEGCGLARALAASLVLHFLILWPALPANVPQRMAQPLAASLRPAAAPERRPAAVAAGERPAPPRARLAMNGGRGPAPAASPAAQEKPATGLAAAAAAAIANTTTTAVPSAAPVAVPAASAAPEQEGLDADGIRAYRIGLARGARAHKNYPSLAQERGWAGTAEVRIAVSGEGRPRQIVLARSSGHEVLDREAVNMMARAAAAAAVPESLRGREFAVSLPVVFDLAGAQ